MDKPTKTPSEELRLDALKHYDDISMASLIHYSIIPRAINFWYDMHSDKPLDREDIVGEGFEFHAAKDKKDIGNYEVYSKDVENGKYFLKFYPDGLIDASFYNADTGKTYWHKGNCKNLSEFRRILKQIGC